jgi:hypothetical protein
LLAAAADSEAAGAHADALVRVAEHERLFPSGALAEEAALIRIRALGGTGRRADARHLAATFLNDHPDSVLAPRVRSLLNALAIPETEQKESP